MSATLGRRLLLACAPVLLVLEIPGAIELSQRPFLGVTLRGSAVMVIEPDSAAESAGLEIGDRIVSLAGRPTPTYPAYLASLHSLPISGETRIEVARGEETLVRTIALEAKPMRLRARDLLLSAVALCFLFLGFTTYLKRGDAPGRYFHGICLLLAYPFLDLPTFPWPMVMQAMETVRDVLQILLPAAFLRFCLMFPEGVREDDPRRHRQRWLMLPPAVLAVATIALDIADPNGISPLAIPLTTVIALLFAAYFVAGVVVFVRKSRRQDRWVVWSKLRLAALGMAVGLLPLILSTVIRQIWPAHTLPIDHASVLFLPMVPASFSLALLRTGAIDLATLTRQGLIALALSLPLMIFGFLLFDRLAPALGGGGRGVAYLMAIGGVLIASVLVGPTRRRVAAGVDRVFFPDSVTLREAAKGLTNRISQLREPDEVAQALVDGSRAVFEADHAVLYRVESEQLELLVENKVDQKGHAPQTIPVKSRLVRAALRTGEMVLVEPMVTGPRSARLDETSRQLIAQTDAVLMCPLVVGGNSVAMLLLGPRPMGRGYSSMHLFHVEMLARQAAASFENALLHQEDLARERMRTELDLAREIQSKLLPEPELHAGPVHVFGQMESSRQVGGDLFDHFTMADGRLVVTVADASGKGVPASLLMSSVRTAVRETMRPTLTLPDAMRHLNREVHGMTALQHFVAAFLGVIDPATSILEYSVAGIEPPLWYRASEKRIETLTRGGPVLGVDPSAGYRSGMVRLAPGDLVLAYSDGITDQENSTGGEFGADRLTRHVAQLAGQDSKTIVESLMERVSGFGEGESTDDCTLLVVKMSTDGTERAALAQANAG